MAKDVNEDVEARNEMVRRNIYGVPTFIIGDDVVVGLDKQKILQLVDHRLVACPSCQKKLRVPTDKPGAKMKCPSCGHEIQA